MVKSLVELCTSVCIKHSREIFDVGSAPYHAVRQILLRVDSAEQLRDIEVNSPHIQEEDAECWLRLIEKDFTVLHKREQLQPEDETLWHEVYFEYKAQEAERKEKAEQALKNAFAGIKKTKETNVSKIVDYDRRKLPQMPREGRSLSGPSGRGRRVGVDNSNLRFSGGSRTKVNTAQNVLKKVRRETKEIHARNRLATPTGILPVHRGQISKAPQGMVNELRVKAQPKVRAPGAGIQAPGRRPPQRLVMQRDRDLEDREARLRKMKGLSGPSNQGAAARYEEVDNAAADEYSDDDRPRKGRGGLTVDNLEDIFGGDESGDDEDTPKSNSAFRQHSSASASTPSTYRRPGLLNNAPGSSARNKTTKVAGRQPSPSAPPPSIAKNPTKASTSSSQNQARTYRRPSPPLASRPAANLSPPPSRPPPTSSAISPGGDSGGAGGQQSRKRKPVDVFMRPKPKIQRR